MVLRGLMPNLAARVAGADEQPKADPNALAKIHPGFQRAQSVVVHRFGPNAAYTIWRNKVFQGDFGEEPKDAPVPVATFLGRLFSATDERSQLQMLAVNSAFTAVSGIQTATPDGSFVLSHSRRNPTALFGAGRIDGVPEEVLEAQARAEPREVRGRVARTAEGQAGRFGWKGQTASLKEFTLTACAVELGLEVPGHHQAGNPRAPTERAKGLDLTEAECDALIAYLRDLPAPVERVAQVDGEAQFLAAGKRLFSAAGCASCHVARLGEVDGIYSDLLLHDMGQELSDTGQYGIFTPDSPGNGPSGKAEGPLASGTDPKAKVATKVEWRTPPLWGARDSAPYMHDGRADTLEQAIAFHGGQARASSMRYFRLKPEERLQLQMFLKSLVAPTQLARADERGD
jgi:hypothetical protein